VPSVFGGSIFPFCFWWVRFAHLVLVGPFYPSVFGGSVSPSDFRGFVLPSVFCGSVVPFCFWWVRFTLLFW
jgi:hypothetical protein